MALMPLREFALIGNRKLLMTTSIFDDFYEKPIAKNEKDDKSPHKYTGKEFMDDRISRLFIGFGYQKFLLDWPEKTLDADFDGYQVLLLLGKDSTWYKVGPSYKKALKIFGEKSAMKDAFVILTHSNGKWYKVSGDKNENNLYTDAYLGLAGYLQSAGHLTGPLTSESDAGFRMKFHAEQEAKLKLEKLKGFYKGSGDERLYKQHTMFALTFNKKSQAMANFAQINFWYYRKGLEAMAQRIYSGIIKPERDYAYLVVIRQTVPVYCSEGPMDAKPTC